jgi:hypothetical protein
MSTRCSPRRREGFRRPADPRVVARVPAKAFTDWLAVNEGRTGGPDYVQVDLRAPQAATSATASGQTRSVVMPIDLAMRIGRLGLEIDPGRLEVKGVELFEAILSFLGTPVPRN